MILGNLNKSSILEIWTSKKSMTEVRKRLIDSSRNFPHAMYVMLKVIFIGKAHAKSGKKLRKRFNKMILGLIPSRLNSKRLKHKPLLLIDGLPIIVHTLKRAMLSKKLDKVIVCADDQRIVNVVQKHGGEAILTSKKFQNGTERIAEVSKKFKNIKLVIDVQGDEPLVDPKDIDRVINFHLKNKQFDIVVPCMQADENFASRNLVKVLFSDLGKVLYFSKM